MFRNIFMKITVKTKNLDLTPALSNYVAEKFMSIKKFVSVLKENTLAGIKTLADVVVEVQKETKHHRKGEIFWAKAWLSLPGKSLMASFKSDDLRKAIVGAKDELKMEIEKHKVKKIDKSRRKQRKAKADGLI